MVMMVLLDGVITLLVLVILVAVAVEYITTAIQEMVENPSSVEEEEVEDMVAVDLV